jgi:large repetitive protein
VSTTAATITTLADPAPGQSATACAEPASPTVAKKIVSVVAGSQSGHWAVTYTVTVANGSDTQVSYSLTDQPGYPQGVAITSTSASRVHSALDGSGASAPEPITTGSGSSTVLATGRLLPPRTKDTYTVVIAATVSSGLSADRASCTGAPGQGWFNAASLTSGKDTFAAHGCDPITIPSGPAAPAPPAPPAGPTPPTALPFTGVPVEQFLLSAIVLLCSGALLLMLVRVRRRRS